MRPRFFRRKGFVVNRAADIGPLLLRVLFHWKVPRIEINVPGLPLLDAQRSQLRLRRLNEILERQTGGLLAIAVLMIGFADMVRTWNRSLDHMALLVAIALGAGLAGRIVARLLLRLWIMLQLLLLRRRIGKVRHAGNDASAAPPTVVAPDAAAGPAAIPSRPAVTPGHNPIVSQGAPLQGRCACGSVTFTLARRPLRTGTCHCAHCRTTGMGVVGLVARSSFRLVSGATAITTSPTCGPCGQAASFCSRCGTVLGDVTSAADPLPVAVHCLDPALDPGNGFHQFVDEKPAWLPICDGAVQFPRQRPA